MLPNRDDLMFHSPPKIGTCVVAGIKPISWCDSFDASPSVTPLDPYHWLWIPSAPEGLPPTKSCKQPEGFPCHSNQPWNRKCEGIFQPHGLQLNPGSTKPELEGKVVDSSAVTRASGTDHTSGITRKPRDRSWRTPDFRAWFRDAGAWNDPK